MIYLDILEKVDPNQIEIYEKYAKCASVLVPFDIWNFVKETGLITSGDLLGCTPFFDDDIALREKLALQFAQEFWKKHYEKLGCKPYEYVLFCKPISLARIAKYDGITKKEYEDGLEKQWKKEMEGKLFQIPELIAAELLIPESHFIAFDNSKDTDEFLANLFHIPIHFLNMRRLALQVKDFE